MIEKIHKIPYKKTLGCPVTRGLINTNQKSGYGMSNKKESWKDKLADELHTGARKIFPKSKVISNGIDDIWCADLLVMQHFSKWNRGHRYLLIVLDIFANVVRSSQ